MKSVWGPVSRVTRGARVLPMVRGVCGRATVDCVVPCARVTVALKSKDHCPAIGHGLIQVKFEVGDISGGRIDVDPSVIEEVFRTCIFPEGDGISLAATIPSIGHKLTITTTYDLGVSAGATFCSRVMLRFPVAKGLKAAVRCSLRWNRGAASICADVHGDIGDAH